MTSKHWRIFFIATFAAIFALSVFTLNSAKDKEIRLRTQKEKQLYDALAQLAVKQAEISDLSKQKKETEDDLSDRIDSLEDQVNEQDTTIKEQKTKLDVLSEENSSLKKEIDSKQRRLSELSQQIGNLEKDKTDLMDTIQKLESVKQEAPPEDQSVSSADPYTVRTDWVAGMDTVQLGKIVMKRSSGVAVSIQHVNHPYGFIVFNAGTKDGMKPKTVINILRDNKLIGKAVIQKCQAEVSAAVLLPEWTKREIKAGDLISRY